MSVVTRCVLFDLFGTLVNYNSSRVSQDYTTSHSVLQSLGAPVAYEQYLNLTQQAFAHWDEWSALHEREFSMHQVAQSLFESIQLQPNSEQLDVFIEAYTQDWSATVESISGATQLLSRCRRDFKTGIITNTHHEPMVRRLLQSFRLGEVDLLQTSVQHGRPKPHPTIFLDTLALLRVAPEEAVYVGDSLVADFEGATSAGLRCYLIGKHARVPREFQIPTVLDLPVHLFRKA